MSSTICSVKGCHNNWKKRREFLQQECYIHRSQLRSECTCKAPYNLHPPPKEDEALRMWLKALNLKKPPKRPYVCSFHFVDKKPSGEHPYPEKWLGYEVPLKKSRNRRSRCRVYGSLDTNMDKKDMTKTGENVVQEDSTSLGCKPSDSTANEAQVEKVEEMDVDRCSSPVIMISNIRSEALVAEKSHTGEVEEPNVLPPDTVSVKEKPVDEENNLALISSTSDTREPNTAKEDMRIVLAYSVTPAGETQSPPVVVPSSEPTSCSNCNTSLSLGQTAYRRKGSPELFCSSLCIPPRKILPKDIVVTKKQQCVVKDIVGEKKQCVTKATVGERKKSLTKDLVGRKKYGIPQRWFGKVCHKCHKLLARPQDITHGLDKGVMKDFCSYNCLPRDYRKLLNSKNVLESKAVENAANAERSLPAKTMIIHAKEPPSGMCTRSANDFLKKPEDEDRRREYVEKCTQTGTGSETESETEMPTETRMVGYLTINAEGTLVIVASDHSYTVSAPTEPPKTLQLPGFLRTQEQEFLRTTGTEELLRTPEPSETTFSVNRDHNYFFAESPTAMKKKCVKVRDTLRTVSKRVRNQNKTKEKMKARLSAMQAEVKRLKEQLKVSEETSELSHDVSLLFKDLNEVPLEIYRGMRKKKGAWFSPKLREFAATLMIHSPMGYDMLREEFKMALPHPLNVKMEHLEGSEEASCTDILAMAGEISGIANESSLVFREIRPKI